MECNELAEHLTDFLEGQLGADETDAALAHLASCPRCEIVLDQTRAVIEAGRRHGRVLLDDEHRASLLAAIVNDTDAD